MSVTCVGVKGGGGQGRVDILPLRTPILAGEACLTAAYLSYQSRYLTNEDSHLGRRDRFVSIHLTLKKDWFVSGVCAPISHSRKTHLSVVCVYISHPHERLVCQWCVHTYLTFTKDSFVSCLCVHISPS